MKDVAPRPQIFIETDTTGQSIGPRAAAVRATFWKDQNTYFLTTEESCFPELAEAVFGKGVRLGRPYTGARVREKLIGFLRVRRRDGSWPVFEKAEGCTVQDPSQADQLTFKALLETLEGIHPELEISAANMIDLSEDPKITSVGMVLQFREDSLGRIFVSRAVGIRVGFVAKLEKHSIGRVIVEHYWPPANESTLEYSFTRHTFKNPIRDLAPAVVKDPPLYARSRQDGPAATRIKIAARMISFRKKSIKGVWLSDEAAGPCLHVPRFKENDPKYLVIGDAHAKLGMTRLREVEIELVAAHLIKRAAEILNGQAALIGIASEEFLLETAIDFERAGCIWFGDSDDLHYCPHEFIAHLYPASDNLCPHCGHSESI